MESNRNRRLFWIGIEDQFFLSACYDFGLSRGNIFAAVGPNRPVSEAQSFHRTVSRR